MFKGFRREVWIGTGLIVMSLGIFFAVSVVASSRIEELSAKIESSRLALAKRAELLGNLAAIKTSAPEAAAYAQKIDSLLPSQEQLLNFPQTLGAQAAARKVSFNFSFQGAPNAPAGSSPGSAPFSIDITGSLDSLLLFLNDSELKTTKYLYALDSFDLTRSDAGDYRISARGKAFFK